MAEQNSAPNPGMVNNPPTPPAQPIVPPAQPNQPQTVIVQKSNPWPWIVGGCLTLIVIIMAAIFLASWWGIKKVKNEIDKYEPTVENVKNNIDKLNQEAEDWEKKSKELQESMPNPEDFSKELEKIK